MKKKSSKNKQVKKLNAKGIALIAIFTVAIVATIAWIVFFAPQPKKAIFTTSAVGNTAVNDTSGMSDQQRLDRINAIYASIGLDTNNSYSLTSSDVFGNKKVYEWSEGRSYSSVKYYQREASVDQTMSEIIPLIEKAGFAYLDEPYPGGYGSLQYHFKSAAGEYVRLSVDSMPYFENTDTHNSNQQSSFAGPSRVTLKVNLDDNNE